MNEPTTPTIAFPMTSEFARPMGATALRDQTCPRHEGPRSYCGCGLPLEGEHDERVVREQRAADQRVLDERDPIAGEITGTMYELVIFTASESQMAILREVAADLESHGDEPFVRWSRDADGTIRGMSLWARLSRETLAGLADVPFGAAVLQEWR